MATVNQPYQENGVEVSKKTIYVGDEVTLSYSGLLYTSGADMVYAYIGYGDEWEQSEYVPMERGDNSFKATIKVALPGTLNVCFKDSGVNWDNNSSQNYVFKITKKAAKSSAKAATEATAEVTEVAAAEAIEVQVPKKRAVCKTPKKADVESAAEVKEPKKAKTTTKAKSSKKKEE
ncbi:MAG: carbohydrate-binding protein [Clostridia bacterium]|nr:carbohydrate-binding protein [Clostridia bacterium]